MATAVLAPMVRKMLLLARPLLTVYSYFCFATTDEAAILMGRLSLDSKSTSDRDRLHTINKKAFTDRLKKPVDEFQVLEDWTEHFQDCAKRWMSSEQDRFLAGYTVLFQSSGMGKTLLLMRYLQRHYGVYICLRPVSTTNYPPRATALADWLLEKDYTNRFRAVTCAVVQAFLEWHDSHDSPTPRKWLERQRGSGEDFADFSQMLKTAAAAALLGDLPAVEMPKNMLLAIFFDEGREILNAKASDTRNAFRHVRDAWKREALPSRVFVALTDTLSTLTNFAPPARADSSARLDVPSEHGKRLFDPFYLIPNMDILATSLQDSKTRSTARAEPSDLFRFGRPLWGGLLSAGLSAADLVDFAKQKVLGGDFRVQWLNKLDPKNADSLSAGVTERLRRASIAMLSIRAAVNIAPSSHLANELVGGHLGVCVHAFPKRESMLVCYPSEPVVAEASAQLLNALDGSGWVVALENLLQAIQVGELDAGKLGELVVRIVLLLAFDAARSESDCDDLYTGTVCLSDFLGALVGTGGERKAFFSDDDEDTEELAKAWQQCTLTFTHFIPVSYLAKDCDFEAAWRRGAAFACKPGQPGADALLPVRIHFKGVFHYSSVRIQIKNVATRHDSSWPESASSKLSSQFVMHSGPSAFGCAALYINCGAPSPPGGAESVVEALPKVRPTTKSGAKETQFGLCLFGLDFHLLSQRPEVRDALNKIRRAARDPLQFVERTRWDRVMNLLPMVHAPLPEPARETASDDANGGGSA
jgi:hypothetical protein